MSTTRERYLQWKNRSLLPQLPIEIWAHIFTYLSIKDLFSVRLVSRLLCSCVNQHTRFWSSVIFNIDQFPHYVFEAHLLKNVRSSNIDLFTKSNVYSHCDVYLKAQPLVNSINKRRKRRLLMSNNETDEKSKKQVYLRCLSVHLESLRSFDQLQLEYLLKNRINRLSFSYECVSTEPSLAFLLRLEKLRHLKISFLHNINELDSFGHMLINTMSDIMILLFKLRRYIYSMFAFFFYIVGNDLFFRMIGILRIVTFLLQIVKCLYPCVCY